MDTIKGVRAVQPQGRPVETSNQVRSTDSAPEVQPVDTASTSDAAAVSLTSKFVTGGKVSMPVLPNGEDVRKTAVEFDVGEVREEGKVISFRVIDSKSGEVIREFPANSLADKLEQAHGGLDHSRAKELLDVLI